MKSIEHLNAQEKNHFTKCSCGEYLDMRRLDEVMQHQHQTISLEPEWDYSIRVGEPKAYTKTGEEIKLN